MTRALRVTYPGAFYHVTSRGNERKAVFKSKRDREKFLEYFESAYILIRSERKWFKGLRSLRGQAIGFISANKNLPNGYTEISSLAISAKRCRRLKKPIKIGKANKSVKNEDPFVCRREQHFSSGLFNNLKDRAFFHLGRGSA